ncbi:MAG TPA: alpha/beta fold hydrolase [Solirubrobacteraceae bacterium]
MRREEINGFGDLLGDAAGGLATQIHEMHDGIARRVWKAVGPASIPVRLAHDRLAESAYSAATEFTRSLVRRGAHAISASQREEAESIEKSPLGRAAVGALNGIWGDTLARRGNELALRMTLRAASRDVEPTREALGRAFPRPTGRLAVFVHGLCETDDAWMLGGTRHVPYGFRLQAELGYTPLYVRYNTGLHISENGRALAELLEQIVAAWPTEVHEVSLIGHSMGGLVARSACHYGADASWCGRVRHVFTLGAPHLGAPLEQATAKASFALAQLPETRALLSRPLNLRSVGIKDLRHGYLVDECWLDQDCDAFLRDTSDEVPFLPTANHYFVCATLSREPDALAGRIVGDLLVLKASAWSQRRGEQLQFAIEQYHHVGGATHFELLNHPAIYEQIGRWMAPRRALPAAG